MSLRSDVLTRQNTLILSDNLFETLPETICDLNRLENLYIANNRLTDLPDRITNLTELKWFSIMENDHLKLSTSQQEWIETLKLRGCKVLL